MAMSDARLAAAYDHCLARVRGHYENFPVASRLLPRNLQRPIAALYCFARTADDLADEGDQSAEQRLAALKALGAQLDDIAIGMPQQDDLGIALADTIKQHALPISLFHDLLAAFRQDVTQTRYNNVGEVMGYCKLSANPIGRLLLHLMGQAEPRNLAYSDAICSALQLINFYQDLAQDYRENDRIYIPQDELMRFDVSEEQFRAERSDYPMQDLMQFQYDRAERLLRSGAPLAKRLPGRFGWEIRFTVLGGLRVLHRLTESVDVFARPRLGPLDWLAIGWQAVRGK